jgi:uncharacterized damage-inducible protein DinB
MNEILVAAGKLPDQALDIRPDSIPTTLRRVLHHLAKSESLWLRRWQGEPAPGLPEDDSRVPLAELATGWRNTAAARDAFLDAQGEGGESLPPSITSP